MSDCPVCQTKIHPLRVFINNGFNPYQCPQCQTLLIPTRLKGMASLRQGLLFCIWSFLVATLSVSMAVYLNSAWGEVVGGVTAVMGMVLTITILTRNAVSENKTPNPVLPTS